MSATSLPVISTKIFHLEPGDVIQAKDRETLAREMAKDKESRTPMSDEGRLSTHEVGTEMPGMPREHTLNGGQILIYRTSPVEDNPSQSAKFKHETSAIDAQDTVTEHAIPAVPENQSKPINNSTADPKQLNEHFVEPSGDVRPSDKDSRPNSPTALNKQDELSRGSAKPKRNSNIGAKKKSSAKPKLPRRRIQAELRQPTRPSLGQPRSRRPTGKSSSARAKIAVDWSEDIRPTDDDESSRDVRVASKGSSVSSPASEADTGSERKRRATQRKDLAPKRPKTETKNSSGCDQFPLTADGGARHQYDTFHDAQLTFKIQDERLDIACFWDAAEMPTASFPILYARDHCVPSVTDQDREVIELSNDSLVPSNLPSPEQGAVSPRGNMQTSEVAFHGRGVTVGQKLVDALREAELKYSAVVDEETSVGPAGHSTVLRPVSQVSAPLVVKNEQTHDDLPYPSRKGGENYAKGSDSNLTHDMSLDNALLPISGSSAMQASVRSLKPWKHIAGGDRADNPLNIPDDSSEAAPLCDVLKSPAICPTESTTDIHGLQSESDTSSVSSVMPMPGGTAMLSTQQSEDEHTPESQKPLLRILSRHPRSAPSTASKSIIRSSIVDRNGSPRLRPPSESDVRRSCSTIARFHVESIRISDSGSSEYEEDSDDHYSESKYCTDKRWSKFKQDMFMEYGLGPEELTPKLSGSSLFGDGFRVNIQTGQMRPGMSGEVTEVTNEEKFDGRRLVEMGIIQNDGATTTVLNSVLRSIDDTRMEASQIPPDYVENEHRISGEKSDLGSRSLLMQGNLDNPDWITDLQAAEQSAHKLLLETNERLSSQLAAEQETIRRVLQIYRQGCNRILDDLFRAQEVRMQLYHQQMSSVKEQHTQICQELIQGLQELDHRVQNGL